MHPTPGWIHLVGIVFGFLISGLILECIGGNAPGMVGMILMIAVSGLISSALAWWWHRRTQRMEQKRLDAKPGVRGE